MMDIKELCTYSFLRDISRRNPEDFLDKIREVEKMTQLFLLMKVSYFQDYPGECWTSDIVETMNNTEKDQTGAIRKQMARMVHIRLLRKLDTCEIRGWRYELTNKGTFVIDQYLLWARDQQMKIHYKIRENKKKVLELKENS